MKKVLLAGFCLTAFISVNAQNKTLGVGTTTVNSNAALHVESPTNNQGVILPRLTTAQRTAMTSSLTAGDEGLMLFDKDLDVVMTWNGTAWQSSRDITTTVNEKAGSFVINNPAANRPAVYGNTNGVIGGTSAGVMGETASAFAGVIGRVTAGFGNGVAGISTSPEAGSWAILGQNTGGGSGGWFMAQGADPAVGIDATGTGTGLYLNRQGTGPGIVVEQKSTANAIGGIFVNLSGSNTYPAVQAETRGNAPGVRVLQPATSAGGGFDAFIQNTASTAIGVAVDNKGLGTTGNFITDNTSNNAVTLYSQTNGTGDVFVAKTLGTGRAAYFEKNNGSASGPAVTVITNATSGTTNGIESFHNGNGDAIFAKAGNGSAGNFVSDNGSNPSSSLYAYSNSTTGGAAIGAIHGGQGNALAIFQGGMKVSTANISAASITTRAAAYNITSGGTTFTFSFGVNEGEVFFVYNGTGSSITINGVSITSGVGRTCIVLGGVLRGM